MYLYHKIERFGATFPLSNQAPFIIWDSPSDQTIFPSQSEVSFNASRSWDLDDDFMTFTWTSSNRWPITSARNCNYCKWHDLLLVSLSDGIHDITLEICDDKGNCVEETRSIELSNQPPVIIVTTDPELSPWGEPISADYKADWIFT